MAFKVSNPFYRRGKSFFKGFVYMVVMTASVGVVGVLEQLAKDPDSLMALFPAHLQGMAAVLIPAVIIGALAAARNWRKNFKVTPRELNRLEVGR